MNTVSRAYELARYGQCASSDDLRPQLRREGQEAVAAHIRGSLARELGRIIRDRAEPPSTDQD